MIELTLLLPAAYVILGFFALKSVHNYYWKHFLTERNKREHGLAFRNEVYTVLVLYFLPALIFGTLSGWLLFCIGWLLSVLYQMPKLKNIEN